MKKIKVESNIPTPPERGTAGRIIKGMAVGDSIILETAKDCMRFSSAARSIGRKPIFRKQLDGQYRLWILS